MTTPRHIRACGRRSRVDFSAQPIARGVLACCFITTLGCAERTIAVGCRSDDDCGAAAACMAGVCLETGIEGSPWQVELLPPTESTSIRTEIPSQIFGSAGVSLPLVSKATVSGTVSPSDAVKSQPIATESPLRVQLTIASRLAGKPDILFETAATGGLQGDAAQFTLSVPANALNTGVHVRLAPPAPIDQVLPPWSGMITLTPTLALAMPGLDQLFTIEGTLLDALQKPIVGFGVRASVGDTVVSNKAATGPDGAFKLVIVRPGAGMPLPVVDLSFVPAPPSSPTANVIAVPSLFVAGIKPDAAATAGIKLPDVSLPAYPSAESLRIPVVGIDAGDARVPVAGATLRFRTTIAGASTGTATFVREAQTASDGMVDVALIPGDAESSRDYSVAIITPADSVFSSRCVPQYAVVSAGQTAGSRIGAPLELVRRVSLSGTIVRAGGAPAAQVAITANRLPSATPDACGDLATALPASTITGADGGFAMHLEPGRYRMEYRPPAGAPSPLFVELVDVDAPGFRMVTLPRGKVVQGVVLGPDQQPVKSCEVRVYSAVAEGMPDLAGQAVSGPDGRFRMVLAAP